MQRGAVTIDLDGSRHYHAIHGLAPPQGPDGMLTAGTARFLEACSRLAVRATLFVVGSDLEDAAFAKLVLQAFRAGHEIASHSYAHDYRLSLHTPAAMNADLVAAREAIGRLTGQRPTGFRAPGYNLSASLLRAVVDTGHTYDSSIFPCWPYFLARAVAIARYAEEGTASRSLIGNPREFSGPRTPYRPCATAHHRHAGPLEKAFPLWEFPIAVAGPLALPLVGTFLSVYPRWLGAGLGAWRTRLGGPLNLEMHALDFAEPADGIRPDLVDRQFDLGVPLSARVGVFAGLVGRMKRRMDVRPLKEWPGAGLAGVARL
jgi:hypothetical protein